MAGTGYYYMMTRSRLKTRPLEFMKYDPVGEYYILLLLKKVFITQ